MFQTNSQLTRGEPSGNEHTKDTMTPTDFSPFSSRTFQGQLPKQHSEHCRILTIVTQTAEYSRQH